MDEELTTAVKAEMRKAGVTADARSTELFGTFVAAEGVELAATDADGISATVKAFAAAHSEVPRFPDVSGLKGRERAAAIKGWLNDDRRWTEKSRLDAHIAKVLNRGKRVG